MKYRFEPVPGKQHAFRAIDTETNQPLDIHAKLMADMAAGKVSKK